MVMMAHSEFDSAMVPRLTRRILWWFFRSTNEKPATKAGSCAGFRRGSAGFLRHCRFTFKVFGACLSKQSGFVVANLGFS
jgi:hypothetical protein